jgi:hypothetical protein
MRIHQARNNGPTRKIDNVRRRSHQGPNIAIATDRDEPSVPYSDRFFDGKISVHRYDLAVAQDHVCRRPDGERASKIDFMTAARSQNQ